MFLDHQGRVFTYKWGRIGPGLQWRPSTPLIWPALTVPSKNWYTEPSGHTANITSVSVKINKISKWRFFTGTCYLGIGAWLKSQAVPIPNSYNLSDTNMSYLLK